ncbi:MAG: nitroreductase family protein, partial [archaeon]
MVRRQSIRKFRDRPLSGAQIKKIVDAAVTAPSSLNSQPWKFVVLKSAAKKKALRQIYSGARVKLKLYAQDTSFVEKATPIVVVCEDNDYGKILSCAMAIQNMFL